MAVTFVGADNSTSLNATAISGLSWPDTDAGDLALFLGALINSATPVVDSEITEIRSDIDQNLECFLGRRLPGDMTGSETGAITMTVGGTETNRMSAVVGVYRGASGIGTATRAVEGTTAVTTHTGPSVTLDSAADSIVLIYAERQSLSASTITPPAGFEKRIEWGTGGSGGTVVCIADKLSGNSAGSQATGSWSSTNAASNVQIYAVPVIAAAGGSEFTGELDTSGAGTLAASGTPSISGTLALSGSGAFAATGNPAVAGAVDLSGSGTALDAGTPSLPGVVALAGDGSLTSAGQPTLPGDLPLSGGGTLSFAAGSDFTGTLALSGSGALDLDGVPAVHGSLGLAGVGAFTAAGTPAIPGDLPLTGEGALAGAGAPSFARELALAGVGAIGPEGIPAVIGALDLTGLGVLALIGGVGEPPGEPGHLVTTNSGPALHPTNSAPANSTYSGSVLAVTNEPSSRLEASHDL